MRAALCLLLLLSLLDLSPAFFTHERHRQIATGLRGLEENDGEEIWDSLSCFFQHNQFRRPVTDEIVRLIVERAFVHGSTSCHSKAAEFIYKFLLGLKTRDWVDYDEMAAEISDELHFRANIVPSVRTINLDCIFYQILVSLSFQPSWTDHPELSQLLDAFDSIFTVEQTEGDQLDADGVGVTTMSKAERKALNDAMQAEYTQKQNAYLQDMFEFQTSPPTKPDYIPEPRLRLDPEVAVQVKRTHRCAVRSESTPLGPRDRENYKLHQKCIRPFQPISLDACASGCVAFADCGRDYDGYTCIARHIRMDRTLPVHMNVNHLLKHISSTPQRAMWVCKAGMYSKPTPAECQHGVQDLTICPDHIPCAIQVTNCEEQPVPSSLAVPWFSCISTSGTRVHALTDKAFVGHVSANPDNVWTACSRLSSNLQHFALNGKLHTDPVFRIVVSREKKANHGRRVGFKSGTSY